MAPRQARQNAQTVLNDQGTHLLQPSRRSERLQRRQDTNTTTPKPPLLSLSSNTPAEFSQPERKRKRKRQQSQDKASPLEDKASSPEDRAYPLSQTQQQAPSLYSLQSPLEDRANPLSQTRQQTSSLQSPSEDRAAPFCQMRQLTSSLQSPLEDRAGTLSQTQQQISSSQSPLQDRVTPPSHSSINPLEYWASELCWPNEYFEPEPDINMNTLPAWRESIGNSAGFTDNTPKTRGAKSVPYARSDYVNKLAKIGGFIVKSKEGIKEEKGTSCQVLLSSEQTTPQDSLFRDDLFEQTCENLCNRNEPMVIRDIALLIVPSAQTLAAYGATHLCHLTESVNEGWNCARPICGPCPQPDYSVGFGRDAFTDNRLEKLEPFIGNDTDSTSLFMGSSLMYFPFLTCEVKCGNAVLNIADRQNAHSMTLAVRGCVELFRLANREKELHQKILGFSISHNDQMVKIYGHYPIINGNKTRFYRHPIEQVAFAAGNGKAKWTSYKFTKNVYDIWMPVHLKRICSAIKALPPLSPQPEQLEEVEKQKR